MTVATAQQQITAVSWWLNLSTSNSWEALESQYGRTIASVTRDTAAVQGMIAALHAHHIATVGIYSTTYQWTQITGGGYITYQKFTTNPVWLEGYADGASAAGCRSASFTGGRVTLTQYTLHGLDKDYAC